MVGRRWTPYAFLAPFIITFLLFSCYPILRSVVLSLFITSGPGAQQFVGASNYTFLFGDPDFWIALSNTTIFAICSVFIQLPLSLGLAMLLNRPQLVGRNVFRFAFFSPHLMGTVFAAVLFSLIFAAKFGIWNQFLHWLLEGPDDYHWLEKKWLGEASLVMPALVLVSLWLHVGFNMIYFLAALQSVDKEQYEAAEIDGAGHWSKFLHVTLPAIKPVTVFVVVLSTIGSFQLFELAYLLLNNGAGPDKAGLTLVMYLYENGFVSGDLGYASAIGWTLALIVLCLALVQMKVSGTMKEETA